MEKILQHNLHLLAALGFHHAADECAVDLAPETGSGKQGQGGHEPGPRESQFQGDGAAQGMTGQVRLADAQCAEKRRDRAGQRGNVPRADRFLRAAVARQIQCIHGPVRGQRFLVEQPVVEVTPETVHQQDRETPVFTDAQVADPAATGVNDFRPWPALGRRGRRKIRLEILDEGIDLRIRRGLLRDHGEQGAHRQGLALLRNTPA